MAWVFHGEGQPGRPNTRPTEGYVRFDMAVLISQNLARGFIGSLVRQQNLFAIEKVGLKPAIN